MLSFIVVIKCLHRRAPSPHLKLTMQDRGVTAALGRRGHLWDTWYAAIQKPFFPFLTSQIHTQTQFFFFESCCKFTNTNGQNCMQQAAKVREASKGETDKKQKQP